MYIWVHPILSSIRTTFFNITSREFPTTKNITYSFFLTKVQIINSKSRIEPL
jgi:hypothetical protein